MGAPALNAARSQQPDGVAAIDQQFADALTRNEQNEPAALTHGKSQATENWL
jgi:hypothetical protein